MSGKNYFSEINELYREKREKAIRLSEEKKAFLESSIPEIRNIDAQLAATAQRVLSATLSGTDVPEKLDIIKKEYIENSEKRKSLLRKNGYTEDYSDVKYDCPDCSDSGFIGLDMCHCMKAAIAEARLMDSDLGRLAETQSFDSFSFEYYSGESLENIRYNYDVLKSFAYNFSENTYDNWLLVGDTGLGKTHLSTAVGVTVIRRGFDVIYKSIQSMIDDFENEQFHGGDPEIIRRYYDCNLLIIDDLGVELSNQFTVSCLYNVVNSRINTRRPTIFSTNLTQTELREKYADRITSRLFGEYKPLLFTGTDIRRQRLQKG